MSIMARHRDREHANQLPEAQALPDPAALLRERDRLAARVAELEERLAQAPDPLLIQRAILRAEQTAQQIEGEARLKAEAILSEAEGRASAVVEQARREAEAWEERAEAARSAYRDLVAQLRRAGMEAIGRLRAAVEAAAAAVDALGTGEEPLLGAGIPELDQVGAASEPLDAGGAVGDGASELDDERTALLWSDDHRAGD